MNPNNRHDLVEQTFPAQLNQLSVMGDFVTEAAGRMDMGQRDIFAIQMAVDEAATNIIIHAYGQEGEGTIHIACWKEREDFIVQLRDHGRPFDPSQVPEPDLHNPLEERREGGLGIYLMHRMMDRVEFAREGNRNILTMVRHCTSTASLAPDISVVSPKGRIDATTSPQLEQMLRGPLEAGQRFLIVDLSYVTYVSSSGLRVLLVAAKKLKQQGGDLILCCLQPSVARVLRMTGFAEILPLYETREAALHALEVSSALRVQE